MLQNIKNNKYHPVSNEMRELFFNFLEANNLNIKILQSKYLVTKNNQLNQIHRLNSTFFDFLEDKSEWCKISMDEQEQEKFIQIVLSSKTYKNNKNLLLSHIVKTINPIIVLRNLKNEDKLNFITIKKCENFIGWNQKEHILFSEMDQQIKKNRDILGNSDFLMKTIKNNQINLHRIENQTMLFNLIDLYQINSKNKTFIKIVKNFKDKSIENSFSEKTFESYSIDYRSIAAVIANQNLDRTLNLNKNIDKIMKNFSDSFNDIKVINYLGLDNDYIEKIIINNDGIIILSNEKIPQNNKNNIKSFSLELLTILENRLIVDSEIEKINIKAITNQVINYIKLQENLEDNKHNNLEYKNKRNKI